MWAVIVVVDDPASDRRSGMVEVAEQFEPPRVCWRLQLLRGWSHDEQNDEQVFA